MTTPLPQISEAQLRQMPPTDIYDAWQKGQLDTLLKGQDPAAPQPWPAGQVTQEELKTMDPRAIVEAMQAGRLNALLGRPVPQPGQGYAA